MNITLRPARAADASECGRILYAAFKSVADAHGFPPDFPSPAIGAEAAGMLIGHPGFHSVVAEQSGRILGSNFLDERSPVRGLGPITVDPAIQNAGVGRRLMQAALDHAAARSAPGVRLVQAAYHNRSLCLYTGLGFQAREPLSVLQGKPLHASFPGYAVRPARPDDVPACNRLCHAVHGLERGAEVADAIAQGGATVVEHLGAITGYAAPVAFFGHAVGRTNQDLMALIGAAPDFPGPGFLLPTRNHELFAWCLGKGLRLVMQMTLMTTGLYNEPNGAWLPSILY